MGKLVHVWLIGGGISRLKGKYNLPCVTKVAVQEK